MITHIKISGEKSGKIFLFFINVSKCFKTITWLFLQTIRLQKPACFDQINDMKIFFMLLFLISSSAFAINDDVIEHYKHYPKTPVIDYANDILDFYSVKDLYGEFSNFALFPLVIDDKVWPSSEHYYQAQKFFDEDLKEQVRMAPTPFEAATLARNPKMPLRKDWDEVKDGVMEKVVRIKFNSYPVLKELILSTNNSHLYEHTKNDCYWADCLDRTGKNRLGEILMKIRSEIRLQSTENQNF